jgi:hypothetical protein
VADLPKIAKSWKAWGITVSAIVATLVLIEKAQPYVEGYGTRELRKEVRALKVSQYELKRDVIERLDRFEIMLAEMKLTADKELIKATIEAVRRSELARTP